VFVFRRVRSALQGGRAARSVGQAPRRASGRSVNRCGASVSAACAPALGCVQSGPGRCQRRARHGDLRGPIRALWRLSGPDHPRVAPQRGMPLVPGRLARTRGAVGNHAGSATCPGSRQPVKVDHFRIADHTPRGLVRPWLGQSTVTPFHNPVYQRVSPPPGDCWPPPPRLVE